jgi:hypothetical protein
MKVIVIVSHPNKASFNHAIALSCSHTLIDNGHEVIALCYSTMPSVCGFSIEYLSLSGRLLATEHDSALNKKEHKMLFRME